jgi:phosphate starvation-inducible protein PhoH and related proteins
LSRKHYQKPTKELSKEEKPDYRKYDPPVPITSNHKKYHGLCKDNRKKIVCCTGWAGTSKSIVAMYYAAQEKLDRNIDGITICRSLEGVGKDPGAYPGGVREKNEPKLKQLLVYASSFFNEDIEYLLESHTVNIVGLHDIQGIDLSNQWLIVTECQTLTPEQMYQVVTRGAKKVILEGDVCPAQLTNRKIKVGEDGLSFLINTLKGIDVFGAVEMNNENDIVRQEYMRKIIIRMMPELEKIKSVK